MIDEYELWITFATISLTTATSNSRANLSRPRSFIYSALYLELAVVENSRSLNLPYLVSAEKVTYSTGECLERGRDICLGMGKGCNAPCVRHEIYPALS